MAQLVNLPAMWETWVQSLGWEDSLEKERLLTLSILAWRIPWATKRQIGLSDFHFTSCGFMTFWSSLHLLLGIWVVSTFTLQGVMLL